VRYLDGQFNDARLAIDLARTAQSHGALLLNYAKVTRLIEDAGRLAGVEVTDAETGESYKASAGCIINATGVWVDALRGSADKPRHVPLPQLVRPSRGVHVVVSQDFMPTANAMLIPKTRDGRVLFMVPWLGHLILGTTDTPVDSFDREPQAAAADIDFILGEAAHYLRRAPTRADVLSTWAGLRPLVQDTSVGTSTKTISREHTIEVAANGLLTVTGGKWTTYRSMAEDVLRHALAAKLLPAGTQPDYRQLAFAGRRQPLQPQIP
jgi:glycerol-3-phosphate dehydrogenase